MEYIDFDLTNKALNELFFTFMGEGSIKSDGSWIIDKQIAFNDYIDQKNAESTTDTDLDRIKYLKKGVPIQRGKLGLYVYTLSNEESTYVDYAAGYIYSTVFVEIDIENSQSALIWKYQDALLNFLMHYDFGLATVSMGAKTYTTESQDNGNYAVVQVDFVLQAISDIE